MRIKKISPTTPANGNIENQYGTSQTNAYSEAYANTTFATKDVATTSANGLMSSSDKTKLDNGEVYSTAEIKIGTWVDGKPLYRKVFILNNITASTSNSDFVDLSGMNIGDVVHLYGIYDATNVGKFPIPLTDSDQNYCVLFVNYSNKIRGRFVNGAPSINARIILEYTKTTD
jgi:hypothetical protein